MTTTATRTKKEVQIVARYQFKNDARKVAYRVHSSDGRKEYTCFLFDGKATSCECPARKPCYHMIQLEQREQERAEQEAKVNRVVESDITQHVEDDITVNAIRNGKIVQVYWNELTDGEREEAVHNICFNEYYY